MQCVGPVLDPQRHERRVVMASDGSRLARKNDPPGLRVSLRTVEYKQRLLLAAAR